MPTTLHHEREVTLRIQSRPLRLACLVRNATELHNAVGLYTHLWGGAANRIFTLPTARNIEQESEFFGALERFDPDYICLSDEIKPRSQKTRNAADVPTAETETSEDEPPYQRALYDQDHPRLQRMPNAEGVRAYGALRGWIGCSIVQHGGGRTGYLLPNSFVMSERYPLGIKRDDSHLLLPPPNNPYDFYFRMKMGAPCPEFTEYLRDGLGASTLCAPTYFLDMVLTQLVSCGRSTAIAETTVNCRGTISGPWESDEAVFFDEDVLGLFLCESEADIQTACCFWNARGPWSSSAIILPRAEVETALEAVIEKIRQAFPALRGVFVVTPGEEGVLNLWHDRIKSAFVSQGADLPVRVIPSANRFPWRATQLKWANPTTLSHNMRANGATTFSPPVPPAHDRKDGEHAFACDVEVTLEGGRKPNLAPTVENCVLLSRDLESIEYFEKELGKPNDFLPHCASVRPQWNGLTLIATAGRQATFFLPSDETIVTRHLERSGCNVRVNRHTRYARGIVNLLGGYVEAARFFDNDGLDILQTLCDEKARQCGLVLPGMRPIISAV